MTLSPTSRNVSRVVMDKNGAYPSTEYKTLETDKGKYINWQMEWSLHCTYLNLMSLKICNDT